MAEMYNNYQIVNRNSLPPTKENVLQNEALTRLMQNQGIKQRVDAYGDNINLFPGPSLFGDGDCAVDEIWGLLNTTRPCALAEWMGDYPSTSYKQEVSMLTYVAGAGTADGDLTPYVPAYIEDHCDIGRKLEIGAATISVEGHAGISYESDTNLSIYNDIPYCDKVPLWLTNANGNRAQLRDNTTWWLLMLSSAVLQDQPWWMITGNRTGVGGNLWEADGLQILANYTNADRHLRSIVVNFGAATNTVDGATTSVTENGVAVANGYTFMQFLKRYVHLMHWRARKVNMFGGPINYGDMALVMPHSFIIEVLEAAACDSICSGDQIQINAKDVQNYINEATSGTLPSWADAILTIGNYRIPIIGMDEGLVDSNGKGQFFLLTRAVNRNPVLYLQSLIHTRQRENMRLFQGGRVAFMWEEKDHCVQYKVSLYQRMISTAPALQVRFTGITPKYTFGRETYGPNGYYGFGQPLVAVTPRQP